MNLAKAQEQELGRIIEKVYGAAQALFIKMAKRKLVGEEPNRLLETIFPQTNPKKVPERWTRVQKILTDPVVTPPATSDTLWGLYNAITCDEDYREVRGATADARLNRVWFGSGSDVKLKTFNICRDFLKKAA